MIVKFLGKGLMSDLTEASGARLGVVGTANERQVTRSERINLIKEISPELGREEWRLIDLTLKEFDLPWTKDWRSNDRTAYVQAMIENALDEVLVALASHLGIDTIPGRPTIGPACWRSGAFRIFISHLATKKEWATQLQGELVRYEISSFVAHKDIVPTREWQDELELALSTADALVALLTMGFHASKWTDQEIGFALGRGLPIISVKLGEVPYGFIARQQAVPGANVSVEELARQLFGILLNHKQTQRRMTEALVGRFERSDSFQEAKDNVSLLERTKYWDARLTNRVDEAVEANDQINGSWNVPERVNRLIQQRSMEKSVPSQFLR